MDTPTAPDPQRAPATPRVPQHRAWLATAGVLLASMAVAALTGWLDLRMREGQRLSLLQTEAKRSSMEIMSQTLNGNLMGSVTLLGLTDSDIKQEASNGLPSEDANVGVTLSILGNAFKAEGVFVVGQDGIVKSSWDPINKPSTGLDVKFRPYYQMAMRGQSSVYAAVSMARGDRSMYFAAPVFSETARATVGIGAIVARTDLRAVDALLSDRFDVSLLLSPQGVVFAGNRNEWLGFIDTTPTAERLREIRQLKQFGSLFENAAPQLLPLQANADFQRVGGTRYAMAAAPVNWNDPSGIWRLLVLEDLSRSLPPGPTAAKAAAAGLLTLLLGWMVVYLLRGRQAQARVNARLRAYAQEQEANVAYRAALAAVSVKLQQCNDVPELAGTFLSECRQLLAAPQGVIYVQGTDDINAMQLAASSASASEVPATLLPGEGLLGQCAVEGRIQVITLAEDGFWKLRSGLGHTQPGALLIAPIVLQGRSLGVVELALLTTPGQQALQQFDELSALLAMNLEILRRRVSPPLSNHTAHALEGTQ